MPFPTDAEQIAFAEQLEATYAEDNRPVRETAIDVLGAARWYGDFRTDCLTLGAAAASTKILAEVRRIMGLPPNPQ